MQQRRILIEGKRIHNVGYRLFLMEAAEELVIPNFTARNIKNDKKDKQVLEAIVGGKEEKVNAFIDFASSNFPENAKVSDVSVEPYEGEIRSIDSYSHGFSAAQLSKIVTVGLISIEKQDIMIEKQDQMLEKQDETLEILGDMNKKQDQMLDKQDQMLEKQEETLTEIKGMRHDLKSYMSERFDKIESEIAEIKEKIGMM